MKTDCFAAEKRKEAKGQSETPTQVSETKKQIREVKAKRLSVSTEKEQKEIAAQAKLTAPKKTLKRATNNEGDGV